MTIKRLRRRAGLIIQPLRLANNSGLVWKTERSNFPLVLIVIFAISCLPEAAIAQASHQYDVSDHTQTTPVRLVLQTSKKRYHFGEPIGITAYLENISLKPYYVGNVLSGLLGYSNLHNIVLKVTDKNMREVNIGRGGGDWIWKPETAVAEKLQNAYVTLTPKMIHGLKEFDDLGLRPGTYIFTVSYHEVEALSWSEADRNALSIPIWTQPLASNSVVVKIIPWFCRRLIRKQKRSRS